MPWLICPLDGVRFFRSPANLSRKDVTTCSLRCAKRWCSLPENYAPRFWAKVDKTECLGDICGCRKGLGCCWVWTAYRNPAGYGQMGINNRGYLANRITYALEHDIPITELPDDIFICHACDVPYCVRHLFPGTAQDNAQDCIQKGRFVFRPPGANQGINSTSARFTEDEVRIIRGLRGIESQRAIAQRFHCSPSAIAAIHSYTNWKHIK
jgi:hypothetical protein